MTEVAGKTPADFQNRPRFIQRLELLTKKSELRLAFSTDNVDDVTTVVSGRHDTKALDDSFTGRIVLSGI